MVNHSCELYLAVPGWWAGLPQELREIFCGNLPGPLTTEQHIHMCKQTNTPNVHLYKLYDFFCFKSVSLTWMILYLHIISCIVPFLRGEVVQFCRQLVLSRKRVQQKVYNFHFFFQNKVSVPLLTLPPPLSGFSNFPATILLLPP